MAGEHGEGVQLSTNQENTLQTYLAVTGQDREAAIPLLRRSEWNVQIAITKFFDGEAPDPVEEARAAMDSAVPAPIPQTRQNLAADMAYSSSGILSAVRQTEAAPRITSQHTDTPPFRPPFILAILFTPFNLIYRLLSSSLRLFGALFPFLPRLFSNISSSTLSRINKSSQGRRSLAPKDTAARFIREFEEEYGSHSLPFLENGYNMALERSHKDLKFLLVVLLSPEHDDTDVWVRDTLLSPEVTAYLNDPSNNVLLWGGNVQDSESYQVANSLKCTKFPFAVAIAHTPSVSSTAMSVIGRIPGLSSPSEFLEKLRAATNQHKSSLDRVRSTRAEQQASRTLRQEQDSAYERSLAQDRERARQRREAEAERERQEREAREQQAAAEKYARDLLQWKQWRAQSIPPEPPADSKDAIRVSLRLTSGERVIRRFSGDAEIEEVYAFVECYDILHPSEEEDKTDTSDVTEPENFEHKYGFRLVSPMPRAVYELEAGGTVKERIGRGVNLLVESIEDDDDDDDE
ncbi:UBX domain-containing protein 10 [Microsporum audouinii]